MRTVKCMYTGDKAGRDLVYRRDSASQAHNLETLDLDTALVMSHRLEKPCNEQWFHIMAHTVVGRTSRWPFRREHAPVDKKRGGE
jgi:hypothetical protein